MIRDRGMTYLMGRPAPRPVTCYFKQEALAPRYPMDATQGCNELTSVLQASLKSLPITQPKWLAVFALLRAMNLLLLSWMEVQA